MSGILYVRYIICPVYYMSGPVYAGPDSVSLLIFEQFEIPLLPFP